MVERQNKLQNQYECNLIYYLQNKFYLLNLTKETSKRNKKHRN